MFGNDNQQPQAANPVNGFNPSNFTPPAALTSAPASASTVDPTMPIPDDLLSAPTSAPSIPLNPLDVPELPQTGTPDPLPPVSSPAPAAQATSLPTSPSTDTPAPATSDDELLDIKQQALQQLSPLVDQLDQTPEEKFRTTMMMIQASDNQSLLKTAYDSAQAITDDKERAQALLDVINEINYFTQHAPTN